MITITINVANDMEAEAVRKFVAYLRRIYEEQGFGSVQTRCTPETIHVDTTIATKVVLAEKH